MRFSWSSLVTVAVLLAALSSSCRFKSSVRENTSTSSVEDIPFTKAGSEDANGLARVHSESLASAPAAIRPDPDLYARRLLKQFQPDGNTMARQLGLVEQYRLMLGGASDDFRTVPQDSYDATSLLTLQTVAQEICTALVAPKSWSQPGWQSVLSPPLTNIESNIISLMSRLLGLPTSALDTSAVAELADMVRSDAVNGVIVNESYVTACTAMAMDAEALLL